MKLPFQKLLQIIPKTDVTHQNGCQCSTDPSSEKEDRSVLVSGTTLSSTDPSSEQEDRLFLTWKIDSYNETSFTKVTPNHL